jgi:DNA-binding response OmpR family regulator
MRNILIIEDEKALVEEWICAFKNKGYHIKTISTFSEFLVISDVESFELALVDIMLPAHDVPSNFNSEDIEFGRTAGVWIINRLKTKRPSMPIIAITAITDDQIIGDIKKAGAIKTLFKPCSISAILKEINYLIK